MFRRFTAGFIAAFALAACATAQTPAPPASPPVAAAHGGVAAGHDPRVTQVGEDILHAGGSATDAAIAMMLTLAVVEPQSTGLGGGGFLVVGDNAGQVEFFDGRETAPAAATGNWFLEADGTPRNRRAAMLSGLSIGVPGQVALAAEAYRVHGRLPWAELFAPAIKLARDGFPITPRLSGSLASFPDRAGRDPAGKAMFYAADGSAPAPGAIVKLPELADTLEMIAEDGPESFYRGPFAKGMADHIAADTPGSARMAYADITGYHAIERDATCTTYRGYKVCTAGPPSSGGVALLMLLKELEGFDLAALGPRNPETWHIFLEAQRLAYADRDHYVGDPAFVDVPLAGLLDPAYLASRAKLIDPAKAMASVAPGHPAGAAMANAEGARWPEHGTTHFVAVDEAGNMASFTATVEGAFGSGLAYRGFYLNNELTDFSFEPGTAAAPVANRVEGGKRPASSMSPTVIYDPQGKPFMAVGAAGGGLIPVETAHAIVAAIDFHLPLEQALAFPFVMDVGDDVVLVEKGTWMEALGPEFTRLGHKKVVPFDQLLRTTGAMRGPDGWTARMDPRLDELVRIPAAPASAAAKNAGFSEGVSAQDTAQQPAEPAHAN